MPNVETPEDLANIIADWIGCYGACKSTDPDGCEAKDINCCRVGFMLIFPDRIRQSVENEKLLKGETP